MTLLICPVRPGDSNEELRYAMRSWETNLVLPNLTLLTVGHKPAWVQPDYHVEGNHYPSVPHAVFDNVRLGSRAAANMNYDEAVFMNDDFFCLDPVGVILPVRRNCSLAQHLAQFPPNAGLWWPRSLRRTAEWLTEQGFPDAPSYEVHRPLVVSPRGMVKALNQWGETAREDTVPQWRTVYGVTQRVDAHPVEDAKLGGRLTGVGTPWISTSDQTWRRYAASMRARFPEPSRWEITS